ncbi:putative cyclic beta-1,2-glucan modification protein [Bdellovibrio bacteriovorus HD100]|uniref:Putative cyclic beta-1,2-glucan modification protein n=2 Tax=Bdellovibrio bacteriovorus TaxID=959 RepID=Q6MMF9_BDEBA|nr:putative cyclic beta-1,2-glucan modification protein [Bdellovibrio bacteriovorus HD100]
MRIRWPEKNQVLWGLLLLSVLSVLLQVFAFKYLLIVKLLMPWLLYFSVLVFLRPYPAAFFVFLLECLGARIHLMKLALTNSPFEASDLFAWKQAFFLKSYVDYMVPAIIIGILISLWKGLSFKKKQLLFLPVFFMVAMSFVQERHPTEATANPVSSLFKLARVVYVDWNFATNVKENGILNHIFLTMSTGQVPTKGKLPYDSLKTMIDPKKVKNQPDVFLVLCESCYTSSNDSFVTPIVDLEKDGFAHATVISPVYGGMTAEAEFEVLTGLPSRRYKGIDYMYFAERYSEKPDAIPRIFADNGYDTFSSHPLPGFFWKREIVHPKFGFNRTFFSDSMNLEGKKGTYPEDKILFDLALSEYKENLKAGKKTFAFLLSLYTHGPYTETDGDGGEADYKQRLAITVRQYLEFKNEAVRLARENNRPVMFVIFGDHKPAMTISFYKRHEFNEDFFSAKGAKNESFQFSTLNPAQQIVFGKVPLYVKSYGLDDSAVAAEITKANSNRPLFCLPGLMFEQLGVHTAYFTYLVDTCRKDPEELVDPDILKNYFTDEIYGDRLFD